MFGLSGDLTGLSAEAIARVRQHIDFYKQWREFIRGASAYLLSPICSIDDRASWIAFQLQNPSEPKTALVFVYRLLDGLSHNSFRLRDLDITQIYTVTNIDTPNSPQLVYGLELHSFGLKVDQPHPNSAAIFIIQFSDD